MARILHVENEYDMAELVRRWLVDAGHEVIQAKSGERGLVIAAAERPDLILLDIGLARDKINGWETNRRLKADPATRDLRVVALTGEGRAESALSEGFHGHIRKPFNFDELTRQVAAFLQAGEDHP